MLEETFVDRPVSSEQVPSTSKPISKKKAATVKPKKPVKLSKKLLLVEATEGQEEQPEEVIVLESSKKVEKAKKTKPKLKFVVDE